MELSWLFLFLLNGATIKAGSMYMWLKVKSIYHNYTFLFDEMSDLRKEASSMLDTLQSLERMDDIRLATVEKIEKAFRIMQGLSSDDRTEYIKHEVEDIKSLILDISSTRRIGQKFLKMSNRLRKVYEDLGRAGDELEAQLPPRIARILFFVIIKQNIDDLNKALSSMVEAQLSWETKQDAIFVRVGELCRFVDKTWKIIDERENQRARV